MTITSRRIISCAISALFFCAHTLHAQQPAAPASAPVPSQVVNAEKVFIINAEGTNDLRIAKFLGGPNGIYNQFYADVKNAGRFTLVSTPAEADVALQVTLTMYEVVPQYPRFKLSILDPKTNLLLWTISEPVEGAILTKTAQKNVAQSLGRLAQDMVVLGLNR